MSLWPSNLSNWTLVNWWCANGFELLDCATIKPTVESRSEGYMLGGSVPHTPTRLSVCKIYIAKPKSEAKFKGKVKASGARWTRTDKEQWGTNGDRKGLKLAIS